MEIVFHKPQDYDGNIKATIHTTGKLGFTEGAIKRLRLSEIKGLKIGSNIKDKADMNLYVLPSESPDDDAFRINKAGAYYYINTKTLFDNMGIDYRSKRISFDIVPIEVNGLKYYKFIYKEKPRNNDNNSSEDDDLLL